MKSTKAKPTSATKSPQTASGAPETEAPTQVSEVKGGIAEDAVRAAPMPIGFRPVPSEEAAGRRQPFWALYVTAFLAAFFLVWGMLEMGAANRAKSEFDAKLGASQTQFKGQLSLDRQRELDRTANAVAASIAPVMALKGQVPELTDRTLQASVHNLLDYGGYRFIAITDTNGTVLASSDLAIIGKRVPQPLQGGIVSRAPIGTRPSLGTVVVQTDAP